MNHFHHLIRVTPLWKMSSMITVCMDVWRDVLRENEFEKNSNLSLGFHCTCLPDPKVYLVHCYIYQLCCFALMFSLTFSCYSRYTRSKETYNADEDEENNEDSAKNGGGEDVTKAHSRHGYHQKVQTFPVGQFLRVGKVEEWIPWVLNLQTQTTGLILTTEHFFYNFMSGAQWLWEPRIIGS